MVDFAGGIFVAAADINGDGYADVITGAGAGGGPHVRVWDARHDVELFGFFAYDPAFAGGVRVAAADVDGDRIPEIITGAGPGGGPHVRVWSTANGTAAQELTGLYAYTPEFAGGVFVGGATPLGRMWIDVAQPDLAQPGVVTIAGWALDEAAQQDPGSGPIHVWAYPVDGSAPTFAGSTMRGDQRADVAQASGGSFSRSGFHLDTTPLPAGTYDPVVYAMGPNGPVVERAVRVTVQ